MGLSASGSICRIGGDHHCGGPNVRESFRSELARRRATPATSSGSFASDVAAKVNRG